MRRHTQTFLMAERNPAAGSIDLTGSYAIAGSDEQALVFTKPTVRKMPTGVIPPAFIRLSPDEATFLMDTLWRAGIRPTEVGSAGELAATKHHLDDMRKLALGELYHARRN